jgi:hypothetical protein
VGDERLELTDEVSMATEQQVGVDAFLHSDETKLFEPRPLAPRERLRGKLGQRLATPEPERLTEGGGRRCRLMRSKLSLALLEATLETVKVELRGLYPGEVARRAGDEGAFWQHLAQSRDVGLDYLDGFFWRRVTPELVDETLDRDRMVRVEEEKCEERPLPHRAEHQGLAVLDDIERPKDSELNVDRGRNLPRPSFGLLSEHRALTPR